MNQSLTRVQIFAAASNAAFANRLTLALHDAGFEIINGAFYPEQTDAVVVIWSGSSINASKLIEAARAPLAAGALVAVSIGRIEPPEEFRERPPIDLGGWSGALDDPRWRSVLTEIETTVAARAGDASEVFARSVSAPSADDIGEVEAGWSNVDMDRGFAAVTPSLSRPGGFRLQPALVFGFALIAAVILGGFISLVAKLSVSDRPVAIATAPEQKRKQTKTEVADETPILATVKSARESIAETGAAPPSGPRQEPPPTPRDEIADLIAANDDGEAATPAADANPARTADDGQIIKDCDQCPELAVIPAGRFKMGAPQSERQHLMAERPVVEVTIARPFALSTHEVTFAEWDACVADGGCPALNDSGWGRGAQPVVNVSWEDANAYVEWLSNKASVQYRLPSEAEWEYAARAGVETPFSFGDRIDSTEANFDGSLPYHAAPGVFRRKPLPVGSFKPNAFGLYDMHGNVWEWVADCWTPNHEDQPKDGSARGGACSAHVLKGGAWNTGGWRLRADHRIAKNAKAREYDNGFRVARDLE